MFEPFDPDHTDWELTPKAGWEEFQRARSRFFDGLRPSEPSPEDEGGPEGTPAIAGQLSRSTGRPRRRRRPCFRAVWALAAGVACLALAPLLAGCGGGSGASAAGTADTAGASADLQNTADATSPGGSTIQALAIDPSSPRNFYASTLVGQVFASADAGATWTPAEAGLPSAEVSALAVDPATGGRLLAGTGHGVFASTDRGAHWRASRRGMGDANVTFLAIDPDRPGRVYAGTDRGVFRSESAGTRWASARTGMAPHPVTALVIEPGRGTIDAATSDGGVFRTTDAGAHWHALNAGLPDTDVGALAADADGSLFSSTNDAVYRRPAAAARWSRTRDPLSGEGLSPLATDTSAGILYGGSGHGGVLSSADGGEHWTTAKGLGDLGVGALAPVPGSPGTVLVGTDYGIFRSADGGATWSGVDGAQPAPESR